MNLLPTILNKEHKSNNCEQKNYIMKRLSKTQLKKIMGGNVRPIASCSANCPNAQAVSLDCGENSTCTASDSVGVKCSGANNEKKCCYADVPCFFSEP